MKYIITIGNFDGLHKGHQEIIKKTKNMADDLNVKSRLITFKSHTRSLDSLILSTDDKLSMIKDMGIDEVVELDFSEVKSMSPKEFLDAYFQDARGIIVGEDFRFGQNRAGSSQDLIEYGLSKDIEVKIIKDLYSDDEKISSTHIRDLLEEGKVHKASELLTYDFFVKSKVEHGYRRGETLGFKTANINWPDHIVKVKYGVYYTNFEVDGQIYDAMTMVGVAKTFNKDFSCESYIFNFDKDIYDKEVKLYFKDFMRENKKFDSKEDLILQLKKDKIKTLELASLYDK